MRAIQSAAWIALICVAGALGCAELTTTRQDLGGVQESAAAAEVIVATDASWQALAANKPFVTHTGDGEATRRWAAPNYGTGDWLPVISNIDHTGESGQFDGSAWVWYPEREFVFGESNAIANSRRVVHLRREFEVAGDADGLADAYVDVMASGAIAVQVFVNGHAVKPGGAGDAAPEGYRRTEHGALPDMRPRGYPIGANLQDGANAIGILATARLGSNDDGLSTPNCVRDGVIAKVVVH